MNCWSFPKFAIAFYVQRSRTWRGWTSTIFAYDSKWLRPDSNIKQRTSVVLISWTNVFNLMEFNLNWLEYISWQKTIFWTFSVCNRPFSKICGFRAENAMHWIYVNLHLSEYYQLSAPSCFKHNMQIRNMFSFIFFVPCKPIRIDFLDRCS